MLVPAKFGLRGVPDIGTPLLEAVADEDAESAKAEVAAEDVAFVDADGGCFFVNDVDEPLACNFAEAFEDEDGNFAEALAEAVF